MSAVQKAKMAVNNNYITSLSICLNVILLIVVFREAFHTARDILPSFYAANRSTTRDVPCSWASVPFESESAIRSTDESLYVMYGEGNFTDTDKHLLTYIRSMTSRQGPGGHRLSRRSNKLDYSQAGGSQFVDKLLKRRRNGFFVECGAFRGENLSDTLFFELARNWTGILIEAHPEYHRDILRKNRHALVLRGCLSSNRRPGLVKFKLAGWGSGVSALNKNVRATDKTVPETDVQCFSLNSIMAAIGVRHIDFMVLDVEGSELPVLESIDWTRLSVDVFSIEYSQLQNSFSKLQKIRHFFSQLGNYKEVGKLPRGFTDYTAQDVIFMRV